MHKSVATALVIALLSILLMITANTRYLAMPVVAVPAGKDEVAPTIGSESLPGRQYLLPQVREGSRDGSQLRVMTYNIHYGTGISGELDLEKTAAVLKTADADIIGLQEVDRNFGERSRFQDQPKLLANLLGMHHVYGESLRVPHLSLSRGVGHYGNMILSRYPIIDSEVLRLPTKWGIEPRTALKATIAAPQGEVVVWSTHLGLSSGARLEQVRTLLAAVNREGRPSVVLGDFNALPESEEIRLMASQLQDAGKLDRIGKGTFYVGPGQSMPRIDYIWLDESFTVSFYTVMPSLASDHLAIVADIVVLSREEVKTGNLRGE